MAAMSPTFSIIRSLTMQQQQELKPRPLEEAAAATAELNAPAAVHDGSQAARVDAKPLLRRVSSAAAGIRRRRSVAAGDLFAAGAAAPPFTLSLRHDVGVVAATETFVITQLAVTVLSYLWSLSTFGFGFWALLSMVGYRWISKILALACYATLLMPGFLQVGYYYYFSSQVWRNIIYGEQPRNSLDLYLPKNSNGLRPVLIFVTGGAWIIGYKAWGSLLGKRLAERGVLVACIDYRNFPQGTISDMVKDASEGISFVVNNVVEFGGDPNRIYLMGQSAGAHIAACALVRQAIKECSEGETITWSISQIRAWFGSSGGYNLASLVDHFHKRGMYKSVFLSIMEGEQSFPHYSPEIIVQDPNVRHAVSKLPPVVLFHGTADYSIPSVASQTFAEALRSIGIQVRLVLYEGKTHTDLFLQDPLRGGRDELLEEIMKVIRAGDAEALDDDALKVPARRLVPEWMLQLAREVSPF